MHVGTTFTRITTAMTELESSAALLARTGDVAIEVAAPVMGGIPLVGDRAKGISFHPTQPYALVSYHDGSILCWNIVNGTIDREFRGACVTGATRAVVFHGDGVHFASCADDNSIQLWHFDHPYPLCSLVGHIDYVRTVEFHPTYPLLLSCSDDQTLRVWDWQVRCCVAVGIGHNHYTMCARWSPNQDMIASGSLDTSVKMWDVSSLISRYEQLTNGGARRANPEAVLQIAETANKNMKLQYNFPAVHTRGVNWVAFHPSKNIVASSADDASITIFAYNAAGAEIRQRITDIHTKNVSSIAFSENGGVETLFSVAEDSYIWGFLWNGSEWTARWHDRREKDRGWVVQPHSKLPIVACGFDSGVKIYNFQAPNCGLLAGLSPIQYLRRPAKGGRAPAVPCAFLQQKFPHAPLPCVPTAFHVDTHATLGADESTYKPTTILNADGRGGRFLQPGEYDTMRRVQHLGSLSFSSESAKRILFTSWPSLFGWLCMVILIACLQVDSMAVHIVWGCVLALWTALSVCFRMDRAKMYSRLPRHAQARMVLQYMETATCDFHILRRVFRSYPVVSAGSPLGCLPSAYRSRRHEDYHVRMPLGIESYTFIPLPPSEKAKIPASNVALHLQPIVCATTDELVTSLCNETERSTAACQEIRHRESSQTVMRVTVEGGQKLNEALSPIKPQALVLDGGNSWLTSKWAHFFFALVHLSILHEMLLSYRIQHVQVPCMWVLDDLGSSSNLVVAV